MGEPPEELRKMDYFHELVLSAFRAPRDSHRLLLTFPCVRFFSSVDELSRCGSGGVLWGLFGGLSIGALPASAARCVAHCYI